MSSNLKYQQTSPPKKKVNPWIIILIIVLVIILILLIVFIILWLTKAGQPGLGESCSGSCSKGLTCQNFTCVCLKPDNPTGFTQTIGTKSGNTTPVNLKWNAVSGADWYNIAILGPSPQLALQIKGTSTIVNLESGEYTCHNYSVSSNCGFNDSTPGSITSFTVP